MLGKSTYEIHDKLEGEQSHGSARRKATLDAVLCIVMLDIGFSPESVITAASRYTVFVKSPTPTTKPLVTA